MEAAAVGTGQLGRGGAREVQATEERTGAVMAEDTPGATVVAAEVPRGAGAMEAVATEASRGRGRLWGRPLPGIVERMVLETLELTTRS